MTNVNKTRNWKESTENNTMVNYPHTSTPTHVFFSFLSFFLNVTTFLPVTEFWISWEVKAAVRQRSEKCDRDFDTNASLGFTSVCFCFKRRKRTANTAVHNTACNHSSPARLCKCHLAAAVRLYTVRFSI